MWFIVIVTFFGTVVGDNKKILSKKIDHIYRLPAYTQLDDYEQCLSEQDGLYCLGTFRINPNLNSNETYNFIKEYSEQGLNFDRTVLHRGYCVSSRCPPHSNPKTRFENCVQQWAIENNMNTTLETFKYCRTEKTTRVFDTPTQVFLLVILLILALNLTGTILDFTTKNRTRNQLCYFWSIRENCRRLMAPLGNNPDTIALAPIQVIRVFLMAVVIVIHVVCIGTEAVSESPEWFEKLMLSPLRMTYAKICSVVQIFYLLSSFLTAYNLLLLERRQTIGLWMLPKQMIKRYFRIAPVHLLFVGFGATLWPFISDGPLWSPDYESAVCRRRLWTHVLHVNNIVLTNELCLPQTWSLAADIQLQLVALFITLALAQYRLPKMKVLLTVLVASCALNACLAYIYDIKPVLIALKHWSSVKAFTYDHSYLVYYLSPWGSLPACIMGLIMAQVYFQSRQEGFKVYKHKWLRYFCKYSLLLLPLWILAGYLAENWKSPLLHALYLSMERPAFCIPPAVWLFAVISGVRIFPGFKRLTWRIWIILGRLSLSVLAVHWSIIITRNASATNPIVISTYNLVKECIITWILSYLLAVPVTLLVEMPIQHTYNYISKLNFKIYLHSLHGKTILPKKSNKQI